MTVDRRGMLGINPEETNWHGPWPQGQTLHLTTRDVLRIILPSLPAKWCEALSSSAPNAEKSESNRIVVFKKP
jgi:hypothetical protein